LDVDAKKIEQYMVPMVMMETIYPNGTLTRMGSHFKNCEQTIGSICPDWNDNGMFDQLHLQGSYLQ